ncbi:MAG: hypothetical protein EXS68_01420 [Candidatus Ryanbacteria bacterium]|nr:hypothetical protein [Candidatus Ryanbacteria bacterium]
MQTKLLKIKQDGIKKTKATYYAEEAIEALRWVRLADGWDEIEDFDEGDDQYLFQSGSEWSFSESPPGSLIENVFTRKIRLDKVYRQSDNQGPIASSGVEDDGSRKVTVTVSWESGAQKVELETYITAWQEELTNP